MKHHFVKIITIANVTHDVKRFTIEKPEGYTFTPGQGTDVSINTPLIKDKKRPFTFSSLNSDEHLEFTIKIYDSHNGITKELGKVKVGDELIIRSVWGSIEYKGEGVFIAGGAGVTPFIAILRQLQAQNNIANNMLIYSNKKEEDIILKKEFEEMLGKNFINTLTEENKKDYDNRMINVDFLKEKISDFTQQFYLCGPPPFVLAISKALATLGAESNAVVFEK